MQFLNVRMNALRRHQDDTYTLTCSKDPHALCHACMRFKNCDLRKSDRVLSCDKFTPILVFANMLNLDKPETNTLRIGKSWYDRLKKDQVVGCYDKDTQQLWFAKVVARYWHKDKELMCKKHGEFNHLGMELIKKGITMQSILEKCYGRGFYSNSNGISAIYLDLLRPMDKDCY